MKRYSIGLVLVGIGLIAGSCVPLVQTLRSDPGAAPLLRMNMPPGGGSAAFTLAEPRDVVPVIAWAWTATAADPGAAAGPAYTFSIVDQAGRVLARERGVASGATAKDAAPGMGGALRLPGRSVPAGTWTVHLDTEDAAGRIRGAEVRLLRRQPGPFSRLLTTLGLVILGWLTASLGALQWIRAEAARPVSHDPGQEQLERERPWVVGCHLGALLGYLIPFGHLMGPFSIWLARRRIYPEVERAGRAALNFQLSLTLYVLVGLMLSFFLIGLVVLFALVVFHFAMVLYAALRAQRGLAVHYPLSIQFI